MATTTDASDRKRLLDQIENRNFLAPIGFHFQVQRAPKVSYFGNRVNIPSISLGVAEQPSYLKNIPLPGEKMEFDDLNLQFLVDEDLENYMEIQNWMRGLGFPESLSEIYDLQQDTDVKQTDQGLNLYSDATLTVLNSQNIAKFKVVFENLFPYSLSTLDFDSTQSDLEYFTAEVSFKYTIYNIREIDCCSL